MYVAPSHLGTIGVFVCSTGSFSGPIEHSRQQPSSMGSRARGAGY
jgi:hypothetical protein